MNLFKDSTVQCTKRRLAILFMLNVSDWICTLALLSTGYFSEANPLMQSVVQSVPLGALVKVLLPLVFIMLALSKIRSASERQILISNNIVLVGVSLYFILNLYHLFCFSLLLFYF